MVIPDSTDSELYDVELHYAYRAEKLANTLMPTESMLRYDLCDNEDISESINFPDEFTSLAFYADNSLDPLHSDFDDVSWVREPVVHLYLPQTKERRTMAELYDRARDEAIDLPPYSVVYKTIPTQKSVIVTDQVVVPPVADDMFDPPAADLTFSIEKKVFVNPFPDRYHRPPILSARIGVSLDRVFPNGGDLAGDGQLFNHYDCPQALSDAVAAIDAKYQHNYIAYLFFKKFSTQFLSTILPPDFYQLSLLLNKKQKSLTKFIANTVIDATPESFLSEVNPVTVFQDVMSALQNLDFIRPIKFLTFDFFYPVSFFKQFSYHPDSRWAHFSSPLTFKQSLFGVLNDVYI